MRHVKAQEALEALEAARATLADILDNCPGIWPACGKKENLTPEGKAWRKKISACLRKVKDAIPPESDDRKQVERTTTITYRWWNKDGEIKPEHVRALEETAMDCIRIEMVNGYTNGELNETIPVDLSDAQGDGVEYRGYWEVK